MNQPGRTKTNIPSTKGRSLQWSDTIECKVCKIELPKNEEYFQKYSRGKRVRKDGATVFHTTCKKCHYELYRKRIQNNSEAFIKRLLGQIRFRAKQKSREYDLSTEFILDLLKRQENKCAYTGLEMTIYTEFKNKVLPTALSVDRIDPNKGYVKDNVQLVCAWANGMKSNLPHEEFIKYCKLVVQNHTSRGGAVGSSLGS